MIRSVLPMLAVGAGVCFVGYCIYFDRKRRSAPDFRKNLMKKRRQQALDAQKASTISLPPLGDPGAMHKFFLEQIQLGESALSTGALEEGVQHFAVAVTVCGQPSQLLQVLQQSLSPTVFTMLVEALPAVRNANLHTFVHLVVPALLFLVRTSVGDRDPFDMFADTAPDFQEQQAATSAPPTSSFIDLTGPPQRSSVRDINTINHYKELHRVLVRIFWNRLQLAENVSDKTGPPVKLQMTVTLSHRDLLLIRTYSSLNPTTAKSVSSDTINLILSQMFDSVIIVSDDKQSWSWRFSISFTPINMFLFCFGCLLLIVIARVGLRRVLWLIVPSTLMAAVLAQALLRKYHERLAEKMSILSRYADPPEDCKPRHLQSWLTRVSNYWSFRPQHDECARYYEQLVTEPWISTDLYEAFWELVFHPAISFGKVAGKSVGMFYTHVSTHIPPLLLLPLFCCFLASLPLSLLCLRYLPAQTGKKRSVSQAKSQKKKQIKPQPPPLSLPSTSKS
ncbi:Mitochondrial import receptor subunit TOM20 B [Paragonimus heterotremus]|uniref:Mitochondrial import receptor subunit TOM20 B n=1 Tax=Paragonimus heterotremus TaxID=100268 RepID=A0A8J4SSN7_9TREM|nr:Mitochondrial import receptor subunit TOM20 B [Paragonimus heterotremus]